MKRLLFTVITFLVLSVSSEAAHIKGGFFSYSYLGPGVSNPNNVRYRVTLTVYMICSASSAQISNPINFSIFDGGTNAFIQNVSVAISNQYLLSKVYDDPCISGNQAKCYYLIVVYDLGNVELPSNPNGYIFSYQRCCRIAGIQNIVNSGTVGNTFDIRIPGTNLNAQTNSSPIFPVNDTVVVCGGSNFQYSFQATDPNPGDSLAYEFCDAIQGADQGNPAPGTATSPPYSPVPYSSPFSGTQPMGPNVSINPATGLISGLAPSITGEFVVSVCVKEYRNGVLIARTRKELHVEVSDCQPITPGLEPQYITCDGFNMSFQNLNNNPLINSYFWDFGVTTMTGDTSILQNPSFTYPDTGQFIVKLIVNKNQSCSDSATALVKVYPGFFPGFIATGNCFQNPFTFTDTTNTRYGVVDSWSWNFGDLATLADTSHIQNPQYTYPSAGPRSVQLIVTNSKGCIDTAVVNINVLDKPPLSLDFVDTLICIPDAVQLNAIGTGNFTWSPPTNISNPNSPNPTVNPTTNTWYVVTLNDNGCLNRDSVHVRVVPGVNLAIMPDTTICLTDTVRLSAQTNGLSYTWTPAATLDNPNILNPLATPTAASTTYQLTSRIGSCFATEDVIIATVPYPVADAGEDPTLCYNTSGQLNGSHNGDSVLWTPSNYLSDPRILNPIVTPPRTTTYILSSFDDAGCPKPGRDTVIVNVRPRIRASAGNDTTVVVGQPLQFNGTGGVGYQWIPSTYLDNPTIANPIGIYPSTLDSIRYKLIVSDEAGCQDSAFILVRIWKTVPNVFVPTAFTPNGDGLNDVVRPIAIGIQKINYFSIYNRWGQLLFTTTVNRHGWDGRIGGRLQNSGVFVWMVSAIDYTGRPIFLKGTVTLIR